MSLRAAPFREIPTAVATSSRHAERIQRLALFLSLAAIVGSGLLGWSAYKFSKRAIVRSVFSEHLYRTRVRVEQLEARAGAKLDTETLTQFQDQFRLTGARFDGSYLCVIDDSGCLVLHTQSPDKIGLAVGRADFRGTGEPGEPRSLLALLEEKRDWVGIYRSLEGQLQMAAFAYSSRFDALIAVHVPWSEVEADVNHVILPWAVSFSLLVFLVLPVAMLLLYSAHVGSSREAERAQTALHDAVEQLRLLRAIDRAILSGGSVERIVGGATAHLRTLIPCDQVSVGLLEGDGTELRMIAVDVQRRTEFTAGSLLQLGTEGAEHLRKMAGGEPLVIADLAVLSPMPAVVVRAHDEGVRAVVCAPLNYRGQMLGILTVGWDQVGRPPSASVEIAREAADLLSVAIAEARLREAVQRQTAELEHRVEERTAQLSEVNDELENYVHTVSHDLRAPLRAIHGFGKLLVEDEGPTLTPRGGEYVARIVSAAQRMEALMRDLIAYSRLSRTQIRAEPLDASDVVEEARALVAHELEERQADVSIETPLLPFFGHRATLVEAVANLLSNAAKFTAAGVRPRIRVGTEPRDGFVRLWVSDNGIGIAPEHHEGIFHVFERLHGVETYPGTGIGLAIVRRAVERMGGHAGVESRLGEGSRFWLDLPTSAEASRAS